ncbi:MAG TPA: hypothetical protein VIL20_16035 [Sandaracinaceae bacterium]
MKASRWRWIALAILVVPALAALAVMLASRTGGETLGPVRGVKLGVAPSQARRMLHTGAPGSFATTAVGEDFALTWTPEATPAELRSARLEFHLGQLVALRLNLSPEAPEARGPELEVSEASVLTRERTPEGVTLTWLARSCPTHADEVRRRLAERR